MEHSDQQSVGSNKPKNNKFVTYIQGNTARSLVLFAVLVLGLAGLAYGLNQQRAAQEDHADHHQVSLEDLCSVGDETTVLPDECATEAQSTGYVSSCSYELPAERQANCPEEASILGDATTAMVWPIKRENWPKSAVPIANCDLLYSKEANKTISTGIEIGVPVGTPVYAAADGVVHYVQPGAGIVITRTNLTSSVNTGSKPIFTTHLFLSERYVNIGDKVVKNQLIGRSGSGGTSAELPASLHFGVWITGDFIGGHPTLASAAGKAMLGKMLHPMNFMPVDGRVIASCPPKGPYSLPVSSATTTPPPTGTTKPSWVTVPRPATDYTRTYYKGKRFDKYTVVLLQRTDKYIREMGLPTPAYTQGSFSTGVSASAGTHSGGGAVDVSIRNYSATNQLKILKAFRMAGFAAWIRTPSEGFTVHLHAIAIGCNVAHSSAKNQVRSYFDGRNGLRSNSLDRYRNSVGYPMPDWAKKFR